MIRKTLLTLALTAGMVGGTAGIASAHECFVANRSAQGNAAATNSANWYDLQLSELFSHAHLWLETAPLTEAGMAVALDAASDAGVPLSVVVFDRFTIPRNLTEEDLTEASADGKGIDHFFYMYGEAMVPAFLAGVAFDAGQ